VREAGLLTESMTYTNNLKRFNELFRISKKKTISFVKSYFVLVLVYKLVNGCVKMYILRVI